MTIVRIAQCTLIVSILSAAGGCSSPAGLVATRPTAINEAPADPILAAHLELFMADHKTGWRKAPSILNLAPATVTPRNAPEDYVLIEDAAGRRFSYGYLNSSLIRKRGIGGNYYYKDVPESEIYRLKGLLAQVPASSSSAYVAQAAPSTKRQPAPAAVAVAASMPEADVDADPYPIPTESIPNSTVPISTRAAAPSASSDEKLAFLKSIWPKQSTLTATTVGLENPGYVYTGSVDKATIEANTAKYESRFGEKLHLRKFGW